MSTENLRFFYLEKQNAFVRFMSSVSIQEVKNSIISNQKFLNEQAMQMCLLTSSCTLDNSPKGKPLSVSIK